MLDTEPGPWAAPGETSPPGRARGAREGAPERPTRGTDLEPPARELELANSVVTLERGPGGPIARIERVGATDYAGPLPPETVDALREVAA